MPASAMSLIIELVARHTHPLAQPIATGIIEGLARPMHANARSLARNEDLRRHGGMNHGSRLQFRFADPTGSDFAEQSLEVRVGPHVRQRNSVIGTPATNLDMPRSDVSNSTSSAIASAMQRRSPSERSSSRGARDIWAAILACNSSTGTIATPNAATASKADSES